MRRILGSRILCGSWSGAVGTATKSEDRRSRKSWQELTMRRQIGAQICRRAAQYNRSIQSLKQTLLRPKTVSSYHFPGRTGYPQVFYTDCIFRSSEDESYFDSSTDNLHASNMSAVGSRRVGWNNPLPSTAPPPIKRKTFKDYLNELPPIFRRKPNL